MSESYKLVRSNFDLPPLADSTVISPQHNIPSIVHFPAEAQEIAELKREYLSDMFDVFSDGLFYMSEQEQFHLYNPNFYNKFGIENNEISLKTWMSLIHPTDRLSLHKRLKELRYIEEKKISTQYRVLRSDGQYSWIEGTVIVKNKDGKRYFIGCHRDISQEKLMENCAKRAVFRDNTSGLANTNQLTIDLEALRHKNTVNYSIIYIQIDDIKSYLNLYGPQILKDLISHLVTSLKDLPEDFIGIYRVHSDDFVVLLRGYNDQFQLENLGKRILKGYHRSLDENGYLYGTEINIGIYPDIDIYNTAEELVKIASRTCQFAGSNETRRISVYGGHTKDKVDRHFYIEQELKRAITTNTLSLKFQPIICTKENRVSSFEALVRWKSAQIGEIYPDEFISVAEKKGLIIELGYSVFAKACKFIKLYQKHHESDVKVNVNVSVLQLLNSQFPDTVKQMAHDAGVEPHKIVLELTETMILDGNKSAASQLQKLSEYGFQLSLDDFGSGYSSLNSFFDLPLNQIKIDKSIAWRSLNNPATTEYVKFIIQLCQNNNVDIVVEGIESAEMQRKFIALGASYLQGYWFSKPLSYASASRYTHI
ncbi:EAL domain-containing protein [Vibrio sp. TRT 17S01]|uniref:EAL domain-containing protein n=1 Tax=Vibrio sp. TRT 17S01 TaxID=3418505 RepID=UPI003CF832B8